MNTCKSEQEYINAIAPAVQRCCKRYGYLPSVLIAQSCLENGYGIPDYWDNPQIEALLKYNNMVGIKSELLNKSWTDIGLSVWPGKSLTKQTPEVYGGKKVTITDNFRKYDNIEQSFADFLLFLTYASNNGAGGTPKYGQSVLNMKDPAKLIKRVNELGYATGNTYADSVMRIVNKHNLTKYDNLDGVQPTEYVPAGKKEEKKTNIVKLAARKIINIIARNLSQVPASRGGNKILWIVIHYLGVPNADNPDLYGGGYGGHFNIERNGKIYNAADPKTAVVWHCGGGLQGDGGHKYYKICTNYNSIGIECGVCYTDTSAKDGDGDSNKWYFTEETQESLVWLVSHLMDEYGIDIDHVIRHYDVTGKICPNPYVKNNHTRTSWTWEEFKANLKQYRKDGTITVPNGNTPAPQPEEEKWYRVRKSWADAASQTGAYISLENAKQKCPEGYAVYDWTGTEVYRPGKKEEEKKQEEKKDDGKTEEKKWYRVRKSAKDEKSQLGAYEVLKNAQECADANRGYKVFDWNYECVYDPFRWYFLDSCQNVVDTARKNGWYYGDSHSVPPCADKKISCDRLIARAMYDLGFKDQQNGGETCGTLDSWLLAHDFQKVTDPAKIMPGAVIAVRYKDHSYIDHVFVVISYDKKTGMCSKYDTGCDERIRNKQPVTTKLLEWGPNRLFYAAYNPPKKNPLEPEYKEDDSGITGPTTYNGIDYKAVYAYSYYKKKYPDLQAAFGNDKAKYFKHFVEHGMKECRQARSTFNPKKYRARYKDLDKAFGDNWPEYYKHYCQRGKKENRKAT